MKPHAMLQQEPSPAAAADKYTRLDRMTRRKAKQGGEGEGFARAEAGSKARGRDTLDSDSEAWRYQDEDEGGVGAGVDAGVRTARRSAASDVHAAAAAAAAAAAVAGGIGEGEREGEVQASCVDGERPLEAGAEAARRRRVAARVEMVRETARQKKEAMSLRGKKRKQVDKLGSRRARQRKLTKLKRDMSHGHGHAGRAESVYGVGGTQTQTETAYEQTWTHYGSASASASVLSNRFMNDVSNGFMNGVQTQQKPGDDDDVVEMPVAVAGTRQQRGGGASRALLEFNISMSTADNPLQGEYTYIEDEGEFGYWAGDDAEAKYPTNAEQGWNIVPESGVGKKIYIVINFTDFKTEPQYDPVNVYPCLDDSCLGCAVAMSGSGAQCPVVIESGQARVTFTSDETVSYSVSIYAFHAHINTCTHNKDAH